MPVKVNILKLQGLSPGYNKPLLNSVNLELTCGLTGVIGNNGKGKSTLLKSICGLQLHLAGKILLNGSDLHAMDQSERSRLVSFCFSSGSVSFPVTAWEVVTMGRYPYINNWAVLGDADKHIVIGAMQACGIYELKDRMMSELSDGERQKVFIAKLLAQQTPVMLFDEPTAFLDYASKKLFFSVMKEAAHENGRIVLISSHDIEFLSTYADSLLMLTDEGAYVYGSVAEVTQNTYFKSNFTRQ